MAYLLQASLDTVDDGAKRHVHPSPAAGVTYVDTSRVVPSIGHLSKDRRSRLPRVLQVSVVGGVIALAVEQCLTDLRSTS